MRKIYNNFTSLEIQAKTVTLRKKLIINVLKNPEK